MSSEPVRIDLRSIENKVEAVRHLRDLMDSPGWKLYAAWLDGQKSMNIDKMTAADVSSDQLHKLSGQTRFLNIALAWPKLTLEALNKQIEHDQKKGK